MPLSNCITITPEGTTINPDCLENWLNIREVFQHLLPPNFPANNLNEITYMYNLYRTNRPVFYKQVLAKIQNINLNQI